MMSDPVKNILPKLRFPEFQGKESWKLTNLAGFAYIVMGSSPPSEAYNEQGVGLPLLQGNADIKNRLSTPRIHTAEITKECFVNDILLSVRAPVGTVAKSLHHACIGRGIAAMRVLDNNSQEFLYQLLVSIEPKWEHISQGGTFDAVNSDDIKKLTIAAPPVLKEQKKIADCLSSLDDLITAQNQKVEALKQHKKGLMQQLFPAEGKTVPKLRFPEFENDGEWQEKPFNEIFSRVTSKNHENNLNVLTISAQMGLVSQLEYFNKSVSAKDVSGYYLLHNGDFAYNKSYSQGYPVGAIKLLKRYEKGVISTLYICFRAKDKSDNLFFEQYFDAGLLNSQIESIAQEGARNHGLLNLSVVDFFELTKLYLPSSEERKKIASFLTSIDELITTQTQQLEAYKNHKKGLMQQLFPSLEESTF